MSRYRSGGRAKWRDALLPPARFSDPSLESEFRSNYVASNIGGVRRGFLLTALIVAGFAAVFAAINPGMSPRQYTRAAILIVLLAGAAFITLRPQTSRRHFEWVAGVPVVAGLLLVATMNLQPPETSASPSERVAPALILALWLAYAFARIELATLALAALAACAVALAARMMQSTYLFAIDLIYLTAANAIGWTMAIQGLRYERGRFLYAHNFKRLSETLADEARRLEVALKEDRMLVRGITHDLRQPLSSLTLYMGDLRHEISRATPDAGRDLEKVEACIAELSSEIDRMLALGRKRDEQAHYPITVASISDLLHDAHSRFARRAERAGVRLLVRRTRDGVFCLTDPDVLKRSLANLIDNAIKYRSSDPAKQPTVLVRAVRVGHEVRIDVVDNGDGIAEADRDRVFDMYWRARSTAAMVGDGIGLHWVRQSLGRLPDHGLALRSKPGVGSRFSIRLPRANPRRRTERALSATA